MKILELKIQGFRSLKDVTWKPGDLNILIGPNGSGKSNLLKALEMLSASARGRLSDQVVSESGMESMVWDGQPLSKVSFDLQFEREEPDSVIRHWTYNLRLQRLGSTSAYRLEQEELCYRPENPKIQTNTVQVFNRSTSGSSIAPSDLVIRSDESTKTRPQIIVMENFSLENETESLLSAAASPLAKHPEITDIQKALAGWRIYQEFQTNHDAHVRRAPITRRETLVSTDGSNLIQVLHTLYTGDLQFKQDLDLALHAAFGDDFIELVFPPDADQRIQLRLRWKGLKHAQSAANLSDGTLHFLYLIAILANPNPPAIIAIDEPENGLHPSMLPIIAEYARDSSKRNLVILTTHSVELLDAFSEYSPTVTVTKWENGQSVFKIVTKKQLDYWLQDYTLGKLFRSGSLEDMG